VDSLVVAVPLYSAVISEGVSARFQMAMSSILPLNEYKKEFIGPNKAPIKEQQEVVLILVVDFEFRINELSRYITMNSVDLMKDTTK
jgi:hypothetical protein